MCKTIKQVVSFQAPPNTIYDLLVDARLFHAVTGKTATNLTTVGGKFTAFGGAVSGITVDLAQNERVVQAWRHRSFPDGIFSMVTLQLSSKPSGAQVVLTHRGVPKDLIPGIEDLWREQVWKRIKEYL